ncbi:acyltransferase family protein [uncultured Friedmanniella sp.]|uniref:acyltransferase family protein n=1 Tax=uncultured Friedmanniella sp. TaxID=335381 RepID=UPI0035CAA880
MSVSPPSHQPATEQQVAVVRRKRLEWMDQLRGTAILLVMIWHAPAIPALFGAKMSPGVQAANMFFLPFRMPTLMVLSGMLLPASLRKSLPKYYVGKIAAIVWPYVLFVMLDRHLLGYAHPWWHWRSWYATSYLWFLFFIGVYYFIAPLLRRVPTLAIVIAFAAVSFVLDPSTEKRLTYFAVFFFLGKAMAERPHWLEHLLRRRWLAAWGVLTLGMGVASSIYTRELAYRIELGPLSFAGILCAVAGAQALERAGRLVGWINTIGRNSLVYYTAHFPIMFGVMSGLYAVHVRTLLVVAPLSFVVAFSVCQLLTRLRHRVPIAWVFQAPQLPTRWATHQLEQVSFLRPKTPAIDR